MGMMIYLFTIKRNNHDKFYKEFLPRLCHTMSGDTLARAWLEAIGNDGVGATNADCFLETIFRQWCRWKLVDPVMMLRMNACCAVNVPLPLTDTVQLPVNGPRKSRYLAINVNCTTVLSLNIQLYNCIAVFPRLHPNTTYMPNTDDTDYTDNRVVFIIWTDNVNAICTTTISSDIQLWYCIAVFPRLYPSNTYLPNTDYTDYTDNRVVFIIWTDNVNAPLTYHCR